MTAAPSLTSTPTLKDGSPHASSPERDSQTPQWPLADSKTPAAGGDDGGGAAGVQPRGVVDEEQQQPTLSPSLGEKQRPWWKTRKAKIGYAVGAVLLVAFVVLLVLGLLGYLRKVGPFASLLGSLNKDAISAAPPPNPLSTINLMSDPFANPAATPTPNTISLTTPVAAAATPTSTALSLTNAVRPTPCCCVHFVVSHGHHHTSLPQWQR